MSESKGLPNHRGNESSKEKAKQTKEGQHGRRTPIAGRERQCHKRARSEPLRQAIPTPIFGVRVGTGIGSWMTEEPKLQRSSDVAKICLRRRKRSKGRCRTWSGSRCRSKNRCRSWSCRVSSTRTMFISEVSLVSLGPEAFITTTFPAPTK